MTLEELLIEKLSHGDEDHRAWLADAISAVLHGAEPPAPYGSGTKEKRIKELEEENAMLRSQLKAAGILPGVFDLGRTVRR